MNLIKKVVDFKIRCNSSFKFFCSSTLYKEDNEIYNIIKSEEKRQREGLNLIASENYTSAHVMEALSSCLTNKYSEGLPGARYYGGTENIDLLENLCRKRALEAFHISSNEWSVNVQPYSGSIANFAALTAFLNPFDRFMGLGLNFGGHLSHGHYIKHKPINISSKYFSSFPYSLNQMTERVDYDLLEKTAYKFYPKLIIAGSSAYPRDWDYKKLAQIAKSVDAILMSDISHFSGLVASNLLNNPFEYSDIVTTTTHKTLRGPRGALFFFRKKFEKSCNFAVFPQCQGGPHNNNIAGIATALKDVMSENYVEYAKSVISNAKYLANNLNNKGYKLVTGGTDTHLLLIDLKPINLNGNLVSTLCDLVNINLNKNSVSGDSSPSKPGGIRIGTPSLTSRGFKEKDFEKVADFLHRVVELCKKAIDKVGKKKKDFKKYVTENDDVKMLKKEVIKFSNKFMIPGKIL